MAYGLLLLRAAPMVLSAAAVQFDYSQYLFLRPYLDLPADHEQGNTATAKDADDTDGGSSSRSIVNTLLGHFVHRQFPAGLGAILVLYPLTWVVAGANLHPYIGRASSSVSALAPLVPVTRYLYAAGLIFSVGHMVFGPVAKDLMDTIGGLGDKPPVAEPRDASKKDNLELLKVWLRLHVTRTFVADVPGWLCFTAAFLQSVRLR
ncbi:hypothetical protein SCUCBS95973_000226 [Sporothrix curviconia]|uniref:Integral membrane protein n=1 Tax=Sporothrix curviconia TaxID=1260050 RepID=A0ABP0ANG6_9PEZI